MRHNLIFDCPVRYIHVLRAIMSITFNICDGCENCFYELSVCHVMLT